LAQIRNFILEIVEGLGHWAW